MQPDAPSAPPASGGAGPTPGPYLREGRTVHVLHEGQVRPSAYAPLRIAMVNRWTAIVQPHAGCLEAEAEAVAELFRSAPDLAARNAALEAALRGLVVLWDDIGDRDTPARHLASVALAAARAAVALDGCRRG